MHLVPGDSIALKIKQNLKEIIGTEKSHPKLVIIYAGENEASRIYVDKKVAWAKEIGINAEVIRLLETTTEELVKITTNLNEDPETSGYILQLPLPKNINTAKVLSNVSPEKDVDGLNPISIGKLYHNQTGHLISATALAVLECLKYIAKYRDDNKYSVDELTEEPDSVLTKFLIGKNVLLINHSILVGKPLTALLLKYKSTVTIAHKFTPPDHLKKLINESDIIISATGQSGLINEDMVHDGQVLIDVGINKSAKKVGGDIDATGMDDLDIWLTPVPDGVGPVTVAMLLSNTLKASKNLKA